MNSINLLAYAKINLGLDVLGTLDNGYHEVRMIMQTIGLYDKVNIYKNRTGEIKIKTNLSFLPTGPGNLVYKAAKALFDRYDIKQGVDIDLYKYIPVAAGMAGGSTDAAAVLKGINTIFELGMSKKELMEIGATLGADIPYCIMGGTALAEGIGEKLTRLRNCPDCYVLIAKPAISVSTKFVYDNLVLDHNTIHPDIDGIIKGINDNEIETVAGKLSNVLETVTEKEYPVIASIKQRMMENGAMGSLMSGSGPTVFGLFKEEEAAKKCRELLVKNKLAKNSYVTGFVHEGD